MIKGQTKPNLVLWTFWAIWPMISSAAALSQGITWATVPVMVAGLNPLCVIVAGVLFQQSYWKLRPFDYFCGGLAVLAIALWAATDEPNLAIAISLIGDLIIAMPTFKKAIEDPKSESSSTYIARTFSALTSFLFVVEWKFAEIAYPIYLITADLLLIFLITVRPKLKKQATRPATAKPRGWFFPSFSP